MPLLIGLLVAYLLLALVVLPTIEGVRGYRLQQLDRLNNGEPVD